MRTVFALFESYREARKAVDELIARKFPEEEMNVIVQELSAKSEMDVNQRTAAEEKSKKKGAADLKGLNRIVSGQRPVTVPEVGPVYAAGKMATTLARAAAARDRASGDLKEALVDFDVPEEIAGFYTNGVLDGGVLFWVRTADERAGEAAHVLSETKGEEITTYPQ